MSTSCAAGGSRGIAFVGDSTVRHVMHGLLQNEWQLPNRTALASIAEQLGHRTFVVELQHTARFAFTYVPMPHFLRSMRDIETLPPPGCKVIVPDSASRAALAAVEYGLRQMARLLGEPWCMGVDKHPTERDPSFGHHPMDLSLRAGRHTGLEEQRSVHACEPCRN